MSSIGGSGQNSAGKYDQKKVDELIKVIKKEMIVMFFILLPINLVLVVAFFSLLLLLGLGKYILGIPLLLLLFGIYIPILLTLRKTLTKKSRKMKLEMNIDNKTMRRLMSEDYKRKHPSSFRSTTYSCSRCGQTVSKDTHVCPKCGAMLSGIQCNACNYVGSEKEFVLGSCPKCGGAGRRF